MEAWGMPALAGGEWNGHVVCKTRISERKKKAKRPPIHNPGLCCLHRGAVLLDNWISSARPLPGPGISNCTSMSALGETVPSGAVPWAWGGLAGPRHVSFSLATKHESVPDNFACCTASYPNLDDPINMFGWPVCQVSQWGVLWVGQASRCNFHKETANLGAHAP
eukprot:155319-Pelagomonas_calceolata.AAC.7